MKWIYGFLLMSLVTSCNEQKNQPSSRPTLVPRDSGIVKPDTLNPFAPVDVSPMDMSYFPPDYPIQKMAGKAAAQPVARVIYSRPHRQGRDIFGSLLKYGEPWRLGANEATEIEFFQTVTIQKKRVPKGRYIVYAIPYSGKWTIILNTSLNTWGLTPNPANDVFTFDIPVKSGNQTVEYFSMVFQKTGEGADLVIAWDTVVARLPIQL